MKGLGIKRQLIENIRLREKIEKIVSAVLYFTLHIHKIQIKFVINVFVCLLFGAVTQKRPQKPPIKIFPC